MLPHSLPVLSHYRPEAARRALPPDLAALAAGAARHLAWPPLSHAAVAFAPEVDVRLIYMHQVGVGGLGVGGLGLGFADAIAGAADGGSLPV